MKILTAYQKNFLLRSFFKNEKYPGWCNIGTKLLETGQCIVARNECIWNGGIGNFIKTEVPKDFVGCTLYKFDLEYFLSSKWYMENRDNYLEVITNKIIILEAEYKEINNL